MATFNLSQRTREEQAHRLAERSIQSGRNEGKSGDSLVQMWSNRLQTPGTESLANFRAEQEAKRAAQEQAARENAVRILQRQSTFPSQQQTAFQAGSFLSKPFQTMASQPSRTGFSTSSYDQKQISRLNAGAQQERTQQDVQRLLRQAAADAAANKERGNSHLRADLNIQTPETMAPILEAQAAKNTQRGVNHLRGDLNIQVPAAQAETTDQKYGALDWLKDTLGGAAKQSVASYSSALSNLYEVASGGRRQMNSDLANDVEYALRRARNDYQSMLDDLQTDPGAWTQQDFESQRYVIEGLERQLDAYKKADDAQRGAVEQSHAMEDTLAQSGAQDVERAVSNQPFGIVGQIGTQGLAAAAQSLADAAIGGTAAGAIGGGRAIAMAPFAIRAYGGGTQEARQNMTQADQQGQYISDVINTYADPSDPNYQNLMQYAQEQADKPAWDPARGTLYGLSDAAIEVFTESMWNIASPLAAIYGGGIGDDVLQNAIGKAATKLAKTDVGQRAIQGLLTVGASGITEGLEEFVGDWLRYGLNTAGIYGGDRGTLEETLSNSLYEFAVGAASGLLMDAPAQVLSTAGDALRGPDQPNDQILPAPPDIPPTPTYADRFDENPATFYENFQEGVRLNQAQQQARAQAQQQRQNDAWLQAERERVASEGAIQTYNPPSIDDVIEQRTRDASRQDRARGVVASEIIRSAMAEAQNSDTFEISDETANRILNNQDATRRLETILGHSIDETDTYGLDPTPVNKVKVAILNSLESSMIERDNWRSEALQDAAREASEQPLLALPAPRQEAQVETQENLQQQQPQLREEIQPEATPQATPEPLQAAAAEAVQQREQPQPQPQPINLREGVTDATALHDVQTAERLATTLGRAGSQAFRAAYDENMARQVSPTAAFKTFANVYNSSLNGKDVRSQHAGAPQPLLNAAYNAGQNDSITAGQEALLGIKPGTKYGVVRDSEYRKARLTTAQARILDKASQIAGVRVQFVDTITDKAGNPVAADGAYYAESNTIKISSKSVDPVLTTFAHEVVHSVRLANPAAYNSLAEFVVENMQGTFREVLSEHADRYTNQDGTRDQNIDLDYLTEESVADAFGRLLGNEEQLEQFAKKDRNALQRFADALKDLITKIQRLFTHRGKGKLTADEISEYRELSDRLQEMHDRFVAALESTQEVRKENAERQRAREAEADRITDAEAEAEAAAAKSEEAKPKFSFAGEKARTADKKALEEAKRMAANGADADAIRRKTGWFKGMDGRWRFEIDDSGATYTKYGDEEFIGDPGYDRLQELLNKQVESLTMPDVEWTDADEAEFEALDDIWREAIDNRFDRVENGTANLEMIYRHSELFKAYPWLKYITVRFEALPQNTEGYFDEYNDVIAINKDLKQYGMTDRLLNTLAHEVQHIIQRYEGFTKGASPRYWDEEKDDRLFALGSKIEKLKSDREDLVLAELAKEGDICDALERFREESLRKVFSKQQTVREHAAEVAANERELVPGVKEIDDQIAALEKQAEDLKGRSSYDLYKNTAGEIEARDVEARRKLTAEQRKEKAPNLGDDKTVLAGPQKLSSSQQNSGTRFSLRSPVEYSGDLVAIHNINWGDLDAALESGGLAAPSIAVIRAGQEHGGYGPISILFGRSTIDPEADSRNHLYGSDAYTPTIEDVTIDEEPAGVEEDALYDTSLIEDEEVSARAEKALKDAEKALKSGKKTAAELVDKLSENVDVMRAFLAGEKRIQVETVAKTTTKETVSKEDAAKYEAILSRFDGSFGTLLDWDPRYPITKDFSDFDWGYKYGKDFLEAYNSYARENGLEEFSSTRDKGFYSAARDVKDYEKTGGKQTIRRVDRAATKKAVLAKLDLNEYRAWLENQVHDRRGTVSSDYTGEEYELTLENLAKALSNIPNRGGWLTDATPENLQAITSPEYTTVEEARRDAGRIGSLGKEESSRRFTEVDTELHSVADAIAEANGAKKGDGATLAKVSRLIMDAARGPRTIDSITKTFAAEGMKTGSTIAKRLQDLYKNAGNLPTRYYEAKAFRAVPTSEWLSVVAPSTSLAKGKNLLRRLQNAGVNVVTYNERVEGDRARKVNEIPDVRFSRRSAPTSDTKGRALTSNQSQFFKDSKVRDSKGRLMVMYHGTPTADFTKFHPYSYFTSAPEYADVYQNPSASSLKPGKVASSPGTYEVYLNIKKPFDTRKAKERRIFMNEFYGSYSRTPLADSGLPDWTDAIDLQDFIEENEYDYDGLILDEGGTGGYGEEVKSRGLSYVIFSPEQVKNVTNQNPTSDPDIRFSLRQNGGPVQDSKGRNLTASQSSFFKDSKAIDKWGALRTLYHQTGGDFTVFDTTRKGAGQNDSETPSGIFMKPTPDDIGIGGSTQMELYANITNPLTIHDRKALNKWYREHIPGYAEADEAINSIETRYQAEYDAEEVRTDALYEELYDDLVSGKISEEEAEKLVNGGLDDILKRWKAEEDVARRYAKSLLDDYFSKSEYDGVHLIVDGSVFNRKVETYIAFSPSQVKSVTNKMPSADPDIRFSMRKPAERSKDLIALHNLHAEDFLRSADLGGLPSPSIAIVKATQGHEKYGPISLIMRKESFDPKARSGNKIYGGDAWTPTVRQVQVDYAVDEAAEERVSARYNDMLNRFGEYDTRTLYSYGNYLAEAIEKDHGVEGSIKKLSKDPDTMKLFLMDTGRPVPDPVKKTVVTRLNEDVIRRNDFIAAALGNDFFNNRDISLESMEEGIRDAYTRYMESIGKPPKQLTRLRALSVWNSVGDYIKNGPETKTTQTDYEATKQAIIDATDKDAFTSWLEEFFSGVEETKWIYNGEPTFTWSGDSRSFSETHWSYTLENITRAMNELQSARGQGLKGASAKSLQALTAPSYRSLDAVRKDSGRLRMLSEEDYAAVTSRIDSQIDSVLDKLRQIDPDNPVEEEDVLLEAAKTTRTIDAIVRTFRDSGYRISTQLAKEIQAVYKAAAAIPTGYFEAKPQYALGWESVAAAIVPSDSSQELLDKMSELGIQTVMYEAGNSLDRLEKLNSVPDVRFSRRSTGNQQNDRQDEELNRLRRENERLKEQVDHWKRQVRTTPGRKAKWNRAMTTVARSAISMADSTLKPSELTADLQKLGEYLLENKLDNTARDMATRIGTRLAESASVLKNGDMLETYGDFTGIVRRMKFNVPNEIKGQFETVDGYSAFRRRYFGRLTMVDSGGTSVDAFYEEMLQRMPGLLDPEITNEAEQLIEIADKLDALKPIYGNPNRRHLRDAAEEIANYVIDQLTATEGLTAPTFADRAQERMDAAVAEAQEAAADQVETARREAAEKAFRADQSRTDAETRLKYVTEERDRIKQLLEQERESRAEEVRRLQTRQRRQRERAAESKDRQRLLKVVQRLNAAKLPRVSRALIDQYIGELDGISVRMTSKTVKNLKELKEWYESKFNQDSDDYDPDFIRDPNTEKKLARLSKKQIGDMDIRDVRELTEVLLNIENEIRTNKRLLDESERRETYVLGTISVEDIDAAEGSKGGPVDKLLVTETLSPVREMHRMTGYVEDDPLYRRTIALADGQRKMLDYQMRAERPFNRFAEDMEFTRFFSGKHAAEIEIHGRNKKGEVTAVITPAMRTALYLHSMNPQNLKHIVSGGITVPDIKLYKKGDIAEAYARGTTMKVTASQVRAITDEMTAKEIEFAQAVHRYLNTTSKDSINRVSERLKGYSLAQVDDYFPINTDTRFTRSEFESLKQDSTIEGMGILKDRVNASNPIYLRDANAVIEQAIAMHAKYVGLAIPVRDMNKLLNVTLNAINKKKEKEYYVDSVKKAIENKWGEAGLKYIEKMMADLQGAGREQNQWGKMFSKLRSNYAGAVLTLNLSVAMKQAASYPTAAAVLGWSPLIKAMGNVGKVDLRLIERYTPLQWYRSKGYSTRELGDMVKQGMRLPVLLNWVQAVDVITTRKLWKASEYYVRANNKDLQVGSDKYYRAVADIYNRVIEETQPNYSVMQRPQLLRSEDSLLANLQMFKTQPFQNTNILYDAAKNLQAKTKAARKNADPEKAERVQAELKQARTDWARAVTSQLGQLAVFAGMTMAWAAFRGRPDKYEDDDGTMTLQSVLSAIGKDMVSDALSGIPFGGDAYELAASQIFGDDYYGMEATTVQALSDTVTSFTDFTSVLKDIVEKAQAGEKIDWAAHRTKVINTVEAASKSVGIPVENVLNIFRALFTHVTKTAEGDTLGQWDYLKLTEDPTKSKAKYYDTMYAALESGDTDAYNRMASELMEMTDGLGDNAIDGAQIESAMSTRYKRKSKDTSYTLPEESMALANIRTKYGDGGEKKDAFGPEDLDPATYQQYSNSRAEYYSEAEERITGSRGFDSLDDDTKDKLLSAAASLSKARALEEVSNGEYGMDKWMYWATSGDAYGVDTGEALLFRTAYNMAEADKDKDGKTIAGSRKENTIEQAKKLLPGLTKKELEYLSSIYWTPDDDRLKKLKENNYHK